MDSRRLSARTGTAGRIDQQYGHLKSASGLADDRALRVFEEYCARAHDTLDSMEWSWKLQGEEILANRVFWLGAGGCRAATARGLDWLVSELRLKSARLPGEVQWREILGTHMDRALVSYAGPNPRTGRPAAVKIYLTLDGCDDALYSGLIRPLYAQLPEQAPPGAVRPLICYAAYDDGDVASRAYFLYHAAEFENPAVVEYFTGLAGPRAVEVARAHPSAGFAFKGDTTNMLGLSLRPTGLDSSGHPSLWSSPALGPLLHAGGRNPLLREWLHRVSWVTVPLTDEALRFPYVMSEMNVYVRLG